MLRSKFYDWIRFEVDAGVTSAQRLFQLIGYGIVSVEDPSPNFAQKARGLAAKLLREREALERAWKDRSTNDDIDDAFAALNAAGIVALQNPAYTQSMSWEDAHDARVKAEAQGREVRGAAFYHTQDLERGVQGEGLYVAFGAFTDQPEPDEEADAAIARELCAALAAHGVPHEWNGSPTTRVRILPFPWRKRRSSQAPPARRRAAQPSSSPPSSSGGG